MVPERTNTNQNSNSGLNSVSPMYLKHILIERFGMLEQVGVGPFAPGLNVVVGPGGGGRDVISAFIGGTLFGWAAASLMAPGAARELRGEGRLVFAGGEVGEAVMATGDPTNASSLVTRDIDVFAYAYALRLRDDALALLDDASRLDRVLVQAAAGAPMMPAQVLTDIESRIATITAEGRSDVHSIPALMAELDGLEAQLQQVRERIRGRIADYQEARNNNKKPQVEADLTAESKRYSALKQKRATLRCELKDRKRELSCLLLARRNMTAALASWDGGTGARIYRMAGLLLEDMTGGVWCQLSVGRDGRLWLQDAQGLLRDPLLESPGTRQQMYLAVRLAVLLVADRLGSCVPVLADDVITLLHEEVRTSAARALDSLARTRQVIVFARDEGLLDVLAACEIGANVVRL